MKLVIRKRDIWAVRVVLLGLFAASVISFEMTSALSLVFIVGVSFFAPWGRVISRCDS